MAKGKSGIPNVPVLRTGSARLVLGLLLGIAALELGISGKLGAVVTLALNPNGAFLYGWDPVQYYQQHGGTNPGGSSSNQSANSILQPPPGGPPTPPTPPLFE